MPRSVLGWLWRVLPLSVCGLCCAANAASDIDRNSAEYRFFRHGFLRANNAELADQIDPAFAAITAQVQEIQKAAPGVTLGGMLSLVLYESGDEAAYFDTVDKENSFKDRLKDDRPFADQPLALYSYQFGLVPIHTSIFRPCLKGTEEARTLFAELAAAHGFRPSASDLESVRPQWVEACRESKRVHAEQSGPEVVDYYVLACHTTFHVPANARRQRKAPVSAAEIQGFPLYSVDVTAPLFFSGIKHAGAAVSSDEDAIRVWGGGNKSYGTPAKQAAMLAAWRTFKSKS
jgi:hypothetical protein